MRAPRALIAGTAVSLALLVASPLVVAHVAGAAGARGVSRAAIVAVDADGASAMLPDGTARVAVPWLQPGDTGLAVSPSGRRLAFSSARAGNRELYVADVATGTLERLTWTRGREDVEPAWSPDGSRLVWASGTESNHDLHAIRCRPEARPAPHERAGGRSRACLVSQRAHGRVRLERAGRVRPVDGRGERRGPRPARRHGRRGPRAPTGTRPGSVSPTRASSAPQPTCGSPGSTARPSGSSRRPATTGARTGRRTEDGSGSCAGAAARCYPWSARGDGSGAAAVGLRRGALELVWGRLDAELAPARSARPPDLDQRAPHDLIVRAAGGRTFVLGFTSATDNLGLGPLWLRARRPTRSHPMLVEQLVHHERGRAVTLRGAGVLRYERHPPHRHWHLDDFVRYELRSLDGRVVVRDRKSGFCLIDRWGFARRVRGIEPALPRFVGDCATLQPDALRVEQGSSVGYTDRYPAFFHGQDLDLTGLPPGRYVLVQTANPERRLREVDYANNAASLLVRLSWSSGNGSAPRIQVLRTCAGSATCDPPQ